MWLKLGQPAKHSQHETAVRRGGISPGIRQAPSAPRRLLARGRCDRRPGGEHPHTIAVPTADEAEAVMLDLIDPLRSRSPRGKNSLRTWVRTGERMGYEV